MAISNKIVGKNGEDTMCLFLLAHGFSILGRNIRMPPGEIDILAVRKHILHFIEVKARSSDLFGTGAHAITQKKLKRMILSAQWYMAQNQLKSMWQIDVGVLDTTYGHVDFLENVTLD